MGLFDKMKTAVGIGGAKVSMSIEGGNHQEGAFAIGTVVVKGGKADQVCDGLIVELKQWIEREVEENGETKKVSSKETLVMKNLAPNGFAIKAGSDNAFQFRIYLPSEGKTEIEAAADIPGALDPKATAKLDVGPGRQGFLPRTALKRLDGTPAATEVNRIGGKPIGIDHKSWPMHEGKAMTHLLTIDLHTLDLPFVPKNRGLAVFCLNPDNNEAHAANSPYTRVVLISPHDIKRGEPEQMPEHPMLAASRLETGPLNAQETSTYFGGVPKWVQGDPTDGADFTEGLSDAIERGGFYCQFDENLVPMNLGDAGVMYVFERTAFWQCH